MVNTRFPAYEPFDVKMPRTHIQRVMQLRRRSSETGEMAKYLGCT